MTYIPPNYKTLRKKTEELQQNFNRLTKRFIPPSLPVLRAGIAKLEDNYIERAKEKKTWGWNAQKPDQTRLDQIGCIKQLLTDIPEGNLSKMNHQAHLILMGALLYRYLRIEISYSGVFGLFGTPESSALKNILSDLLGINIKNTLDSQTIASCCGAYRDYLKLDGVANKYVYIKSDLEFFDKLEKIIEDAIEKAKIIHHQLQYIVFIQSIPIAFSTIEEELGHVLSDLVALMIAKLKDKESLNKVEILDALKEIKKTPSTHHFLEQFIIPDDVEVNQLTVNEFKGNMLERLAVYFQYALLGAYIITLNKCHDEKTIYLRQALSHAINEHQAIGENEANLLDNEARDYALTSLSQMIEVFPDCLLNLNAWGDFEFFKAELLRQSVAIQNPDAVLENNEEEEMKLSI